MVNVNVELSKDLHKKLKIVSVEKEVEIRKLVVESIEDLVKKYKR